LIPSHPPYPYHILQSTRPLYLFPSSFCFDFLYSFASDRRRDNDIIHNLDHRVPLLPLWEVPSSRSTPQQGNQSRITKVQSSTFSLFIISDLESCSGGEKKGVCYYFFFFFFFTTKRGFPRLCVIIAGDGNHLWGYRLSESLQVSAWLFHPLFYPFFMFLFFWLFPRISGLFYFLSQRSFTRIPLRRTLARDLQKSLASFSFFSIIPKLILVFYAKQPPPFLFFLSFNLIS